MKTLNITDLSEFVKESTNIDEFLTDYKLENVNWNEIKLKIKNGCKIVFL